MFPQSAVPCSAFDVETLEQRVKEYSMTTKELPLIVLYDLDQGSMFDKGTIVECNSTYRGDVRGWVIPKTKSDLFDMCFRLSRTFEVPFAAVEAALWLQAIYYHDCEGYHQGISSEEGVDTPEWAMKRYQVLEEVATLLCMHCGKFGMENVLEITRALDKGV